MKTAKKILLVDDVKFFLDMEKSFFARENIQVTTAQSAREVVPLMRALRPNLVIMDLHMPEMDGATCCRQIKSDPELFTTPVILISDSEDLDERELCRNAGCDEVISRPLNRHRLRQVAREFLQIAERATPRVKIRMLVHYGVEDEKTLHDYSVNISAGGIFLETSHPMPVDTPVTLDFFVPGVEETIRCKGRVTWLNAALSKTKPDFPAGVGIAFEEIPAADSQRIREFIHAECAPLPGGDWAQQANL
ncbi:TIGR02266 family protein [Desulfuromonas sp. AOP6]|uniref:TIGR02266 family protein n=1 Tax=Desulfuromonas sp. AOP6 TaxID=1566351 RepID=UPI00127D8AFA|nr:TIGR02266 family protein [Desulfuromonas sp. AOP6]BCA78725.1 two-component system response regulator [Desulfuromonas sp. AOP6]